MKSTTRFNKNKRGIECLNCSQPIGSSDNFCSNCGQVNDEQPLSIVHFFTEFFAGFFSFDSRFFNTFIPLLFKPGKVSKEYIEGKRKRYVNPFQLYLHITILYFLISGFISWRYEYTYEDTATNKIENINKNSDKDSIAKNKDNVAELDLGFIDLSISNNTATTEYFLNSKDSITRILSNQIKKEIDTLLKEEKIIKTLKNSSLTTKTKDSVFDGFYNKITQKSLKLLTSNKYTTTVLDSTAIKTFIKQELENEFKKVNLEYDFNPDEEIEDDIATGIIGAKLTKKINKFIRYNTTHKKSSVSDALDSLNYKKTSWNIFYYKKAVEFNKFKNDADYRKTFITKINSKISVGLFVLLPIFTFFFSLFYIKHKKNYTEHLIFVFNVQTAFFILLIFVIIIDTIFNNDGTISSIVFSIVFSVYFYKSLRNFYKENRFTTILKFIILICIYNALTLTGLFVIMLLSFIL